MILGNNNNDFRGRSARFASKSMHNITGTQQEILRTKYMVDGEIVAFRRQKYEKRRGGWMTG